jgi:hypothetical protein
MDDAALNSKLEPSSKMVHLPALRMDAVEVFGLVVLIWLPLAVMAYAAGPIILVMAAVLMLSEMIFIHVNQIEVHPDRLELQRCLSRRTVAFRDVQNEASGVGSLLSTLELQLVDGRKLHFCWPTRSRPEAHFGAIIAAIGSYRSEAASMSIADHQVPTKGVDGHIHSQ